MWLPQELALLVGSYLRSHDLRVCMAQLCSSGAEFVANDATKIDLHELAACCRLSAGVEGVAQGCIERIESFVVRRGNVRTIVFDARLRGMHPTNASVYADIHRRLQQGSSFQLSQNQEITVKWCVTAKSIAQIHFLLCSHAPNDGGRVSDARAGGALRQHLHQLDLVLAKVSDVTALATCQSLHTLNLMGTSVRDMTALASCQSLHTLNLVYTKVSDVSALASCQSLHKLDLGNTQVSDVSTLGSCQFLYKLDLSATPVSDVAALASCQSLHTLYLANTQVSDVSTFASCQSLHTLDLGGTRVSDVSALASCQSLHTLNLSGTLVSDVSALASCQSLHGLDLGYTLVSNVSALASCQSLHRLRGVQDMIGGLDVLRIISGRGKQ